MKGLNKEFYYLFSLDVELFQKTIRIDNMWKKMYLNKAALVSLRSDDEDDAFIDVHAEHSLTHQDGFRVFKKRGL
jgi:hypothetical protein